MRRLFFLSVMILSVLPADAFDQKAVALHLRKNLGLDTRMEIEVSSVSSPSGFTGLNLLNVMIQGAPYPVFMSQDESRYIFGGVVGDLSIDPDKARASIINLAGAHAQGSSNAPVTIVEFSDLQCGHCKVANEKLKKELYQKYTTDQVRLVFKHFPLNGHLWAESAAVAAECAARQKESTFWDMTTYFFANQEIVSTATIKAKSLEAAKSFKLDEAAFNKCIEGKVALARVRADKKEGTAVGVNSTPTIFVNGRQIRMFRDFEDIKVVVEEKMKEAKK